MRAALIGLGMASSFYDDAFKKSQKAKLSKVFARNPESRGAFWKNSEISAPRRPPALLESLWIPSLTLQS